MAIKFTTMAGSKNVTWSLRWYPLGFQQALGVGLQPTVAQSTRIILLFYMIEIECIELEDYSLHE